VKVIPIGGTSSGKIIREGKENEYSYNATNRSSYTVIVKFGNRTFEFSMRVVENFEEEVKKFEESISKNSSTEITIIPEKIKFVRPNKSLKLKFNKKNSVLAEDTAIDTSTLIWKLNGKVLNAKGAQIEIPREIIANCKKDNNKVEVFKNSTDKKAVAFCEFSVAKNKVNKFDVSKRPVLAGKKVTFEVKDTKKEDDYMIFKNLDDFENIHWEVIKDEKTIGRGTGFKFDYTFKEGGKFQVKCYIFDEKGEVKEDVNVIQPKIFPETAQWIDKDGATGNILEKAGYYQKIYAFVKHQDLLGEKVIVDVYDDDKASADDWITSNYQLVENKENIYIPFVLTRDHKEKIKDSLSEEGKLFFKVKSVDPQFHIGNSEAELAKHLTIVPDSEIVDTYFCDEGDTVKYNIQELSTSIFLKIYAINMVSRKIRVCVLENVSDTTRQCMNWDSYYRKSLCQKEVAINDKGEAILPIDLTKFTQYNNGAIILSAVMIRSEYKLHGKDYTDYYRINAKIVLIKEPSLPHMEENLSPVKVLLERVNNKVLRQEIGGESGVLDEMKKFVDKHIEYSQKGIRNSISQEGLSKLDCSETVAVYLYQLGIIPKMISLNTAVMITEKSFRKTIGNENIDFVLGSEKSDFKPQKGDIFVWRHKYPEETRGHTGIVYEYDEKNDIVTILEAIGKGGSADERTHKNNGGYTGKGCTRTSFYKRNGKALASHPGWIGYFRPKNYLKKL